MENPDDKSQRSADAAEDAPEESSLGQTKPETDASDTAAEPSESLQDWINRAKRAHEIVDAVDLKKVADHDEDEILKMAHVSNALQEIGDGKLVEHVEGVDEVVPELDANQQRRADIIEKLTEFGWGERVGRLLSVHGDDSEFKPIDLIPHHEGLPEFDVCLAPESAAGNGNFGLFVSKKGIFAASVNDPPSKHHWIIARSRPWESSEELRQTLEQFSNE